MLGDRATLGFVDTGNLVGTPPQGVVSISRTIFDGPSGATKARESETKHDSAYLMVDTNLRRISSWMAW
jgi:hypothetical protein